MLPLPSHSHSHLQFNSCNVNIMIIVIMTLMILWCKQDWLSPVFLQFFLFFPHFCALSLYWPEKCILVSSRARGRNQSIEQNRDGGAMISFGFLIVDSKVWFCFIISWFFKKQFCEENLCCHLVFRYIKSWVMQGLEISLLSYVNTWDIIETKNHYWVMQTLEISLKQNSIV